MEILKKIITNCIAVLMTAIVFLPLQIYAQAPQKISYQAVVRNSNNVLVASALISMRVSILQGSEEGAAVYAETHTTTSNINGLVSFKIGDGIVVSGIFATINWANGPYFIKTETDPTGGNNYSITATSQLLSVPYALYAATAGNNTAGPQGPQGAPGLLSSGSAAGNTPYWNGTDWVINSSNIHNNGESVGIGTSTPNAASKLEVSSNTQGFLPPRMTNQQRDAIANPVDGLIIFNISSGCPNYYFNGKWQEWCGTGVLPLARVITVSCDTVLIAGSLWMGQASSGVTVRIPYTGGNGGTYPAQTFASTGVNGLSANLYNGALANGAGNLLFTISGTPDNSGTASFQISIGGQTCNFSMNVGLPAPVIVSSMPASPSNNSTMPTLFISGPANKTIELYNNATGSGTPVATVNTDGSGNASVAVMVSANTSTTFSAKAIDGTGNVSGLSNAFNYVHGNIAPAIPTILRSTPQSPSRLSTTPFLTINAQPGSFIQLYTGEYCTGIPLPLHRVGENGIAEIMVAVNANALTRFTAIAMDTAGNRSACSAIFTYVHDNVSPAAPGISSNPASPSNSNLEPTLGITSDLGSTLFIYSNNSCEGTPLDSIILVSPVTSVRVTVPANATTIFTAKSRDAAGNTSNCATPFSYTHDNVAPDAPVIVSSTPAGTGKSRNPTLNITGEVGTTLHVYDNGSCSGIPVATTTMVAGSNSVVVTVAANSTTIFTAKLIDAAGNISTCSNPITYVNDITPPAPAVIVGTVPATVGTSTTPTLNITGEPGATLNIYNNGSCTGLAAAIGTIGADGTFSISMNVNVNTTTVFSASITDIAGNRGGICSNAVSYTQDSTPPAAPVIYESVPSSPGVSITPTLKISCEPGATVHVYPNGTASGAPTVTATDSNGDGQVWIGRYLSGEIITVSNGSSNVFTAKAVDSAGNVSAASSVFLYRHIYDKTPPDAARIASSIPVSPGNSTTPQLEIVCEPGASVSLYDNKTATGVPLATYYDTNYDGFIRTLPIAVIPNSTTNFSVKQTDASGNVSLLYGTFTYVHLP
jgi:hypothetical protein